MLRNFNNRLLPRPPSALAMLAWSYNLDRQRIMEKKRLGKIVLQVAQTRPEIFDSSPSSRHLAKFSPRLSFAANLPTRPSQYNESLLIESYTKKIEEAIYPLSSMAALNSPLNNLCSACVSPNPRVSKQKTQRCANLWRRTTWLARYIT